MIILHCNKKCHSGHGSNGNEEVLHIPQSFKAGASSSDEV